MTNKDRAIDFLVRAAMGEPRSAARDYFADNAKHHNGYFPAGMPSLIDAMETNARDFPNKSYTLINAAQDQDIVMCHGRVELEAGTVISVVHILRFEGEKIVEFWDVGQVVQPDLPNADGMF